MNVDWRNLIPADRGTLPLGGILRRTEANGAVNSPIVILGVYPAATKWETFSKDGIRLKLPVEVEARSFDPTSRSGGDLDRFYLEPLGVVRTKLQIVDLIPYFFANTAKDKTSGRSMWDNIQEYERITGIKTSVEPRPSEDDLINLCRTMAGNKGRLTEYLGQGNLKLLITLGNETAAYVRGYTRAIDGQKHLYTEAFDIDLFGHLVPMVHLVHPGNLQRSSKWRKTNEDWCENTGRRMIQKVLSQCDD
jgi:hypothetical protein